jgi:hypothetical protein
LERKGQRYERDNGKKGKEVNKEIKRGRSRNV